MPQQTVPPKPDDEPARLQALHRYAILDTPPEECFDRIARLAAQVMQAPIALITFVDAGRQWFKARCGLDVEETNRDVGFCAHAVVGGDVMVVPDALDDARFRANPFVKDVPHIRFYAGAPLQTPQGHNIGTLCVIDRNPRCGLPDEQRTALRDLAAMAVDQLEMRLATGDVLTEVTSRLAVERQLSATEAQLRLFIEHVPAPIAMVDRDMRFLAASRRWLAEHRLGDSRIIGRGFYDVLPETPKRWKALHRRCLAGEVLKNPADTIHRRGGRTDWVRWELRPWWTGAGDVGGLLIYSELINDQKRSAEELERHQEFLKAVLENVEDAIIAFDPAGHPIFVNGAARRYPGLERQLLRPSVEPDVQYVVFEKDGHTRLSAENSPLVKALHGEVVRDVELIVAPRTGLPRRMRSGGQAMLDRSGRKLGAVVSLHDITERKLSEERLRESERRFRDLYNNTPVMLHSIDQQGRLISVSDYWLHRLGYERYEVIGRTLGDLLTPESREHFESVSLPYFSRTGTMRDVEHQFLTKAREPVDVLLSAIAERDADGRFIRSLAVSIDITERKRTEAQLHQAVKTEAIGQLAGGLAHDFNNLLTVILGNLQLLERSLRDDQRARRRARIAIEAVLRGSDLTQRLLAFARRQTLTPRTIDVNGFVGGMHELLRRTLGEAIQVKIRRAQHLWLTRADPGQLEASLLNLALNARDAMPMGGTLAIETQNVCVDASPTAPNDDVDAGDYVMIVVSDTGSGIPRQIIDKIFEPFFTTKDQGKGSGLGLSMVYGFVKQMGGYVKVVSEEERGTTVQMLLPRDTGATGATGEGTAAKEEAPRGQETILVVEDDPGVRQVAVSLLRELGYRTLQAADGPTALIRLEDHDHVDLLFTDVVMPGGMSGAELAKAAVERQPDLKVLHTTGYADAAVIGAGALANVISKPYRKEDLARRVRQVLDD